MSPSRSEKKSSGTRRRFASEYEAEVVRLCQQTGKTAYAVATELGLSPSSVTRWVRQAQIDASGGGEGPRTTTEREESAALRRENRTLRQERDILRKATALFAREGLS